MDGAGWPGVGRAAGARDAEESDLAVREEKKKERWGGWGGKKSDGDGCAIVLDAVERRRGHGVRERRRASSARAFRGWGRASRGEIHIKIESQGARGAGRVRLPDLWMTVRTQDLPLSLPL